MELFAVAFLSAFAAASLLTSRLAARDRARALRRFGTGAPAPAELPRRSRPLLIQAAEEARGRMASSVLQRLHVKQSAERLLETAAISWGAAGLLHRSVAMFLAAFAVVTLGTGNALPLMAVAAGTAVGALPFLYVRRKAKLRVRAFD